LRFLALIALAVVALSGCGSVGVLLGLRTRLDKIPITSLSASLSPDPGIAPGKSERLIIIATAADGTQYVTTGAGHGKVLFDSFTFDALIAKVSKSGMVKLPTDPRLSDTQIPHVKITAIGHPDIVAELEFPCATTLLSPAIFQAATAKRDSRAPTACGAAAALRDRWILIISPPAGMVPTAAMDRTGAMARPASPDSQCIFG
jgi:hypothetical protein